MDQALKKYTVKIPKDIFVIYSKKKKLIILRGLAKTKLLKLKTQLCVVISENLIKVTALPFFKNSKNYKKKSQAYQGTYVALLKQLIIESSIIISKKLKLVGVGYWVFSLENFENKLVMFKLGYSHFLYYKASWESQLFCLKLTQLFIYGSSYQKITQTAARIRSYKRPEPYKGKGILYSTEKINLKEGKKA